MEGRWGQKCLAGSWTRCVSPTTASAGEPVDDVEVLLAKEEQAVHRFQPLDAGATKQVAHLFILFQQTHQVLPILRLLLLLGSRCRSVVRPNGGHQQLRQVELCYGRVQYVRPLFSALDRWRHQRSHHCRGGGGPTVVVKEMEMCLDVQTDGRRRRAGRRCRAKTCVA